MRAVLLAMPLLVAAASVGQPIAPGPQARIEVQKAYLANSLICHDPATGTTCQLWLEPDGRYQVGYNRGPQPLMPSIDGPWQIEGREGAYYLRSYRGVSQLCLTPDGGSGSYDVERGGEPFAGSGCVNFPDHSVGDRWTTRDAQDRVITYWLVEGR